MTLDLTLEQQEAVYADAPALQIAAGAGTGKTHTLAHRVERLVRKGVPAPRILVITFTRDATASLQRRINLLLGKDNGVDVRSFHSLAARELKDAPLRFLDAAEARKLARRAAGPLLQALPSGQRSGEDPVERFLALVSYCKNREVAPFVAIRERFHLLAKHADAARDAYEEYVASQEGALDFEDLLVTFRNRLRDDPAFRARIQARLDHLLVDEYQDVNRVQHEIVLLIARPAAQGAEAPHVAVVGDERQAIYGFRGGDASLLANFTRDFDEGLRVALTRSFRSAAPILDHANRIFPDRDPLAPASANSQGPLPRAVACASPEAEAEFVLDDILRLVEGGHAPEDIAVLYRSHHLAEAFEKALRGRHAQARRASGARKRRELEAAAQALDRVVRSTIHGAKGLEWDHVYLIGAREGGIPASISERRGRADGASSASIVDRMAPKAFQPSEVERDGPMAEERCLFYVAATRPRRTFTVTWPERDRGRAQAPSRFLAAYLAPPATAPTPVPDTPPRFKAHA